jgi:inner membrane protein YidH
MGEQPAEDSAREPGGGSAVRAQGGGRELDYRMSLAAERTYLAYLRTGLAMTAAGVAVVAALPDANAVTLRRVLGAGLVLAGAAVFATARPRWAAVVRAMERGDPLPRTSLLTLLAVVLTAGAAASLIVVLVA